MRLYCRLEERDKFDSKCQEYLHLRLLNNTSKSNEAEELLIQKIELETGL